ncbi:MAG: alpha-D-ribose 1-methylphosphonate 5-triphosphate diphosphatase [Opitutales bacterium]
MSERFLIKNATVVLADDVISGGSVFVESGKISQVGADVSADAAVTVLDAQGMYLIPGLVDMHTDAIEKEIAPRPSADFPAEMALQELDQKMLACGITTVFHSTYLGYHDDKRGMGSADSREDFFRMVAEFGKTRSQANTKLHLRFEITGVECVDVLRKLIDERVIDLLSFMDHTPGQGQYSRERFLKDEMKKGLTEEQALEEFKKRNDVQKVSQAELKELAEFARSKGVCTASHDDDTLAKVADMHDLGVSISEFPITLEAAKEAKSLGMHVLGGSTNFLRGGSLTGNLAMVDAVAEGALDGFCSDYYPPSMIHAVFKLWQSGVRNLPESVAMASLNPAIAVGIDGETGSIAPGKVADMLLVEFANGLPKVRHAFVKGKWVHHSGDAFSMLANPTSQSAETACC